MSQRPRTWSNQLKNNYKRILAQHLREGGRRSLKPSPFRTCTGGNDEAEAIAFPHRNRRARGPPRLLLLRAALRTQLTTVVSRASCCCNLTPATTDTSAAARPPTRSGFDQAFADADENKDGKLSADEFAKAESIRQRQQVAEFAADSIIAARGQGGL